ncbi:FG-GAP repeat protein [candidate division KSB1 bacterium]|nr:FG-GAP repeat protein [candidate division KSB1 bacterium]
MKNLKVIIALSICFSYSLIAQAPLPQLNTMVVSENNQLETIFYHSKRGQEEGSYGYRVAGIGDINMDGFDDVAVSIPFKGNGEVLIYFGGKEMDDDPDLILTGEHEGDAFGSTLACGRDINGDGGGDFLIAALQYPNRQEYGRVYVYFGGALLDTIPDVKYTGENFKDMLGFSITTANFNNDQYGDFLFTASVFSLQNLRVAGKAYLYLGNRRLVDEPIWTNRGDESKMYLGVTSAIGDWNGDGLGDVFIGSVPHDDDNNTFTYTEIFINSGELDTIPEYKIIDPLVGDITRQVLYVKDLNLDGFDDCIVYQSPICNIFYGSTQPDTIPDAFIEIWPLAAFNRLADAGDVNGDGYPDILAGHWHWVFQSGSVGLFLGGRHINPRVDWTAGGAGYWLDGAGDVNGDGYDDIIVSYMYWASYPKTGKVWILAGRPDLEDLTEVKEKTENIVPENPALLQNYPNPFNSQTNICYRIANKFSKHITLTIYDMTGKEVIELVDTIQPQGEYRIQWNGFDKQNRQVGSGVYLCRLDVGGAQLFKKLIFIK